MKQCLFIVFLFAAIINEENIFAQTELLIPWQDSLSVRGISHINDSQDNTYILGTLDSFYSGPGIMVSGDYIFGSVVLKINKDNNLVWKQNYPIANIQRIGIQQGLLPARQLFIKNDSIFIPYNIDMGYNACTSTSISPSTKNGALVIDKNTGNILLNNIFYEGSPCGVINLLYTSLHKNNNVSYLYCNEVQDTFYINERDAGFNFISTTAKNIDPVTESFFNIGYDPIADRYLTGGTNGLHIFDNTWNHLYLYQLPFIDSLPKYNVGFNYACNDSFIAVNYYGASYATKNHAYTAVFTKSGQLISVKQSLHFTDMVLTVNNDFFGISSPGYGSTAPNSVTFVQMDLYQNIKRKETLGKPCVVASRLSITDGNDIIITGTSYTSSPDNTPKAPDNVYYYRQKLQNIPLLINDNGFCNSINAYPNPARNQFNINSNDFNTTYNANVQLCNVLGQQLIKTNWVTQSLSFDLSYYPAGIYFLKVSNAGNSCVSKIIKQ